MAKKFFDVLCKSCGHEQIDVYCESGEFPYCPSCGGATERLWRTVPRIIPDDIPGGLVVENLGHNPVKVYSRSELKREAERRGLVQHVKHVDGSKHTSRWV